MVLCHNKRTGPTLCPTALCHNRRTGPALLPTALCNNRWTDPALLPTALCHNRWTGPALLPTVLCHNRWTDPAILLPVLRHSRWEPFHSSHGSHLLLHLSILSPKQAFLLSSDPSLGKSERWRSNASPPLQQELSPL